MRPLKTARRILPALAAALLAGAVLAAGVPAVEAPGPGSGHAYVLSVSSAQEDAGNLTITLHLDLMNPARAIPPEKATLAVLVQPHYIAPVSAETLGLGREYSLDTTGGLSCMVSPVSLQDSEGATYRGALFVCFGGKDLGAPGAHTLRLELPLGARAGVLSIALFRQDDPQADHLTSTRYRQASNAFNQPL
jgi:hypothetical protein